MTNYGYIGLGTMGEAMAENLIRQATPDATVTVFDLSDAAVEKAVGLGAVAAGSPAEVAAASDVVSICVPAAEHIAAVLSGPGGIAEAKKDGLGILIHSTVHPDTMTSSRKVAASWGANLFDACVAGGPDTARTGEQVVLAGGVDEMPVDVRGLVDIYAAELINGGPVGSGAALKIAINVMTYQQFAAATTSHDLVANYGADPKALLHAWKKMGQLGRLTEQFTGMLGIPAEHIQGDFRQLLETQVGIATKDLTLALELGEARPGMTPILEAVRAAMPQIYNVADTAEESS